jgi:hypothetical protein
MFWSSVSLRYESHNNDKSIRFSLLNNLYSGERRTKKHQGLPVESALSRVRPRHNCKLLWTGVWLSHCKGKDVDLSVLRSPYSVIPVRTTHPRIMDIFSCRNCGLDTRLQNGGFIIYFSALRLMARWGLGRVDGAETPRQNRSINQTNKPSGSIGNYGIIPSVLFVILSQGVTGVITPSGKPVSHDRTDCETKS